ncbi:23S rRNA (guanosine(2251)-2'-O)-methyltransferase RlmB [Pelagibacteraceae bacterium]|nr:23S rRNA (guanosine(2251)-2'-O)-methyltransferase RlmB [Pelagibacteraceae bacterium]
MTQFYDFKIENIKDLSIEEKKLRKKNLDLFIHNGFPNKKDEDWKFTDLNSILEKNFNNIVNKNFVSEDKKINKVKERSFPSKSKLLYKSASGGAEHIKIFQVSNINTTLKFLKTKNFWVSAFDVSAKKDFTTNNWKGKNVLLFGSEGYGIKAKTLEKSDFKFRVQMNGVIESLNISNTVSVVCHHIFQTKNRD